MSRAELTPAYLLHSRPYRDTSLLLTFFTRDHGHVGAIAKGARRGKQPLAGVLQPCNALLVSWTGKGELVTLTAAELQTPAPRLPGMSALGALYANELLYRLLHRGESFAPLFAAYRELVGQLGDEQNLGSNLRLFEKQLIKELGYELQLQNEATTGAPVESHNYYRFVPETGPVLVPSRNEKGVVVAGQSLLDFHRETLSSKQARLDAKKITQHVLDQLLGQRPLHTRELMKAWWESERG